MKCEYTLIVPPIGIVRICGVTLAKLFSGGRCELIYEDGGSESATLSADRLAEGRDNFFRLVSGVQEQRIKRREVA